MKVKEWYEVKGEKIWYGDEEADRENYIIKYASDEGYPYSFALLRL